MPDRTSGRGGREMNVAIIGAPVDLGADRRGVDMGPSAIRYAGLAARLREMGGEVRDFGNVPVAVPESTDSNPPSLKYLQPIVAMCEQLATTVSEAVRDGWFPLVLGRSLCLAWFSDGHLRTAGGGPDLAGCAR
jgi:arginase